MRFFLSTSYGFLWSFAAGILYMYTNGQSYDYIRVQGSPCTICRMYFTVNDIETKSGFQRIKSNLLISQLYIEHLFDVCLISLS